MPGRLHPQGLLARNSMSLRRGGSSGNLCFSADSKKALREKLWDRESDVYSRRCEFCITTCGKPLIQEH